MMDVSDVVGQLGWYHLAVGAVTVLRAFPTAWTLLLSPFVAADVDHWCAKPTSLSANLTDEQWLQLAIPVIYSGSANSTGAGGAQRYTKFERCLQRTVLENGTVHPDLLHPCKAWTYNDTLPGSSAVPEWGLVCTSDWQRSLMQSVAFAGSLVGALLWSYLSDRFGRRPILFSSTFAFILFSTSSAASPTVTCYNSLRFLTAFCVAGFQTTAAAIFTEMVQPRHRTLLNIGFSLGFTLPTLLLPGLAYTLGNWKYLQLASGLSGLMLIPFVFILQESPRWLMSVHREVEARRSILKILRINGRPPPTDMEHVMNQLIEKSKIDVEFSPTSLTTIVKHKRLCRNAICLSLVWFCNSLLLFTTTLSSVDLGGNPFVNFLLSAAGEVPGGIVSLPVVRFCHRKKSQAFLLLLVGTMAILISALPQDISWLRLLINMMSRCLLVISGAILWVYTMELFPTSARCFGFAACFTMGRIGAIFSPFMRDLGVHVHVVAPTIVLTGASVCAAAAVSSLPETLGLQLPDTFEEANNIGLDLKDTAIE